MMSDLIETVEFSVKYSSQEECRWETYSNYRLILWAWMLNETAVSLAVTVISHNGFYIHMLLYIFAVIVIGIPLAYSEICLAQYTNGGIISLWNFFPLFRSVAYGSIYLVFIKYVYLMALTSWYLQYTFHAALDPPPWYTCDEFENCMVKRINVSIYQHCLEAQFVFEADCGVKTASNCFYEREIGNRNTLVSLFCMFSWKSIISSGTISCILVILSLKNNKFIRMIVKFLALYLSIVVLVLLSVVLSTSGAWYATKTSIDWSRFNFEICFETIISGFLSVGTGYGIIGFLSKDVPFRSPATMTAISTSLLAAFVTSMYSIIMFSGIKTMSYYHGEEENVIEEGISLFFKEFASASEILSYFDQTPIWGFAWFSSTFLCLLCNLWILHTFLRNVIVNSVSFTRNHANVANIAITFALSLFSWPLFCVDITGAFLYAIEIIQLSSNFFFAIALYWFYDYKKHNIDIIFMIGIKASYFWKITWVISPILILCMLYTKLMTLETQDFEELFFIIEDMDIHHDILIIYIIVGIYGFIVVFDIIIHLVRGFQNGRIRNAFVPTDDWGPTDPVLFKSRTMFVPEIMTREFLYRQVRIHGYKKNKIVEKRKSDQYDVQEITSGGTEWSAFTSN